MGYIYGLQRYLGQLTSHKIKNYQKWWKLKVLKLFNARHASKHFVLLPKKAEKHAFLPINGLTTCSL